MATITQLPLDLTAKLSSNLRSGEVHTLTKIPNRRNRMFAPKYGAYYKDSLEVRSADGKVLKEDVDYVCTYYYDEVWQLTAKSGCAIIVVINPNVGSTVRIRYQAVGGHYCFSVEELKEMLDNLDKDQPDIPWDQIRNKPLQFTPSYHEHELWQLYGMESTVTNLDMITKAWAAGRKGILDDNRYYYRSVIDLAGKAVSDYTTQVMAHINDRNNPHKSDKRSIGLSEINNWGMANLTEGATQTVNNKYQPIGSVYDQMNSYVIPAYNDHIRNTNNPHRLDLSDPLINAYTAQQIISIFENKLKINGGIAYNSSSFANTSNASITNSVRSQFSTANVQPNVRMPQDRMAPVQPGWNPAEWVLMGNNTYASIPSLMGGVSTSAGVIFIGSADPNSFNYPVGTFVIRTLFDSFFGERKSFTLYIYERTAGGWAPRFRT